jgi:zinc and cadmium transporter
MFLEWIYTIASVVLVSFVSLIGIAFIPISERRQRRVIFILVSFAVGGLFGDAFIHLLPESFEKSKAGVVTSLSILAGIFGFFILEKYLRWKHEHGLESNFIHPVGYVNLLGDGVHNFIDGAIIGASYLACIPIGIATTIAVILHEIPQEIGDFGILLRAGFSKTKALLFNFLSQSLAIAGAIVSLLIGVNMENFSIVMLPFAAGGFIYIAGSDLVPDLHKEVKPFESILQFFAIGVGIALMLLLTTIEI